MKTVKIIFQLLSIINVINSKIYPTNRIYLQKDNGFVVHHIPNDQENFGKITKCFIEYKSIEYELDQKIDIPLSYNLKSGEYFQRYSKDYCGLRLEKLSEEGQWTIKSENSYGNLEVDSFAVIIHDYPDVPDIINTTQLTEFGTYVQCPFTDAGAYCIMKNDLNEVYDNQCYYSLSYGRDIKSWTCQSLLSGSMVERINTININEYSYAVIIKTIEDNVNSIVLTCRNQKISFKTCIVTRPDNSIVLIENGLLYDRYSAYNTKLENGICSIEILKPLQKHEYGIWTVEDKDYNFGCIFSVGEGYEQKFIAKHAGSVDDPTIINVDINIAQKTVIKCNYPTEIEYCFIQNPKNEIESVDLNEFSDTRSMGKCKFTVVPLDGIWICHIRPTNIDSFTAYYYKMKLFDGNYIEKPFTLIKKQRGKTVDINCKTVLSYSILHCNFLSPSGIWYAVTGKDNNSSKRIQSKGSNLKGGECNLQIKTIEKEDFGNWTCYLYLNNMDKKLAQQTSIISIEEHNAIITSAAIIGTLSGLLVLAPIGFVYFIYRRYYFNRRLPFNSSNQDL